MKSAWILVSVSLSCPTLWGQVPVRVSVDSTAAQADAPSLRGRIAANGRFVVFESDATNLVAGDTNALTDVFFHDRLLGTTELVCVSTQGVPAIFGAQDAVVSTTGRFVAFSSFTDDLTFDDLNGWEDVFVRDRQTGTTESISLNPLLVTGNRVSRHPSISGDGRYVAFDSRATNLLATLDANFFVDDVFVRDRATSTTEMISVDDVGAQGNSVSRNPSISSDGRFVAFESAADNLVAGDTNGSTDVFLRDRQLGTTRRVSVSTFGVESDGESRAACISGDGRFVAFESSATNLVTGDTNLSSDIFVHDTTTGTTIRASVSTAGSESAGDSYQAQISFDGRYVAFAGYGKLDAGDSNSESDVFVRDLQTNVTRRVNLTAQLQQVSGMTWYPALSGDGRTVVFTSSASTLVDGDTNAGEDVFVVEWPREWETVCAGDGTGTACPCANESDPGELAGCANSLGTGGRLALHGNASIGADTLVLSGSSMPNGPALYFQGNGVVGAGAGAVFGDGLVCATGSVVRLAVRSNTGGASTYPSGAGLPVSVVGACSVGAFRAYQVWYRDSAPYCAVGTFNVTNGATTTWSP